MRSSVFIASLIAHEYGQSKRFDLALKFYDRILRGYRVGRTSRDGWWNVIIAGILERVVQCAIHLGMHERILESAFELIGLERAAGPRQVWMDTFLRSLKNLGNFGLATVSASQDLLQFDEKSPTSTTTATANALPALVIDMTSQGIETFYDISATFASDETTIGSVVPLQLTVHSRAPQSLYPTGILVEFSDSECNAVLISQGGPSSLEEMKSMSATTGTHKINIVRYIKFPSGEDDNNPNNPNHHQHHHRHYNSVGNLSRSLDTQLLELRPNGQSNIFEIPIFVGNSSSSGGGLLVATSVTFVFGSVSVSDGMGSSAGRSFHFIHKFPVIAAAASSSSSSSEVGEVASLAWWNERNEKERLSRNFPNSIQ